jgi:TetR/AcrR family transcriptional repressor of lmrAB and yxaGH operons
MSTRLRLIAAAVNLFQARGYFGVGVAEILAAADAPKGSLYHHFPDGKEALAIAAVAFIADEVAGLQNARAGASAADFLKAMAVGQAAWLKRTGYAQASLYGALAPAAGAHPDLAAALQQAFDALVDDLQGRLMREGVSRKRAKSLALAGVAALEGGQALARLIRSPAPLIAAVEAVAAQMAQETAAFGGDQG